MELRDEIQGEHVKKQNMLRENHQRQIKDDFPSRRTMLWNALTMRTFSSRRAGHHFITDDIAPDSVKQVRHNRHAVRKAELSRRLIIAVAGTACLVAPILIMSIQQTKMQSLITASVSLLIFGTGLAVGSVC